MSSTRTQARSEMSRLNVIRLLAFGMLLIFPATSEAQQSPPIAEQMAKTYGLDSFGQIEAIRYTWNVESPDLKISRHMGMEPEDRHGLLRGERQGRQTGKGQLSARAARLAKATPSRTRSIRHSPTISIGCCSRSTSYGTARL